MAVTVVRLPCAMHATRRHLHHRVEGERALLQRQSRARIAQRLAHLAALQALRQAQAPPSIARHGPKWACLRMKSQAPAVIAAAVASRPATCKCVCPHPSRGAWTRPGQQPREVQECQGCAQPRRARTAQRQPPLPAGWACAAPTTAPADPQRTPSHALHSMCIRRLPGA